VRHLLEFGWCIGTVAAVIVEEAEKTWQAELKSEQRQSLVQPNAQLLLVNMEEEAL
jgi:hypothetical protein